MRVNYYQILDMLTSSIRSVNKTLMSETCYNSSLVKLLDQAFDFPSKKINTVHITGTNGKGSVALKMSKAFSSAGYRVGLFSSPHLTCFRERIRINGEYISEEDFARIANKVIKASLKCSLQPIFFEVLFMISMLYFLEKEVDLAIIEVGIGGRLDSTNIITPLLSIITSIDYDHVPFLGSSLDDISYQKAGIIKKNVPVALGPTAQRKIILDEAKKLNAETMFSCAYGGFFDDENIDLAALSLKFLSKKFPKITDEVICEGVKHRPNARFEVIPSFIAQRLSQDYQYPEFIVLDVAHNLSGMKAVFEAIKLKLSSTKIRLLLGVSASKKHDQMINYIIKHVEGVHILPINHIKLEKPYNVKQLFSINGFDKVYLNPDLRETLKEAFLLAKANDEVVLICGSFFIMADVRVALGYKDIVDEIPSVQMSVLS